MGKQFTIFLVLLLSILTIFSHKQVFSQNVGEKDYININNMILPFNNKGDIAEVSIPGQPQGGYYQGHEFLFSAGFWLSGYTGDSLWASGVAASSLVEDYQPGIVGMDPADPKASLYKVSVQDPPFGQSWQDWIHAVDLGADFYDGDGDGIYNPVDLNNNGVWDPNEDKPDIIGDESFWCVYNDGVPASERRWGAAPQGIEIRQTIFAFASSSQTTGNVVFVRYRIKNTGLLADTLQDVYFCHFADADIGEVDGYVHNLVGCDTLRNAAYTYMKDPSPQDWGNNPPCFLTDLLTGPLAYIPGVSFEDVNNNNIYDEGIDLPLDSAYSYRGPLGVPVYPGALNQKMTSAEFMLNSDPILRDPENINQARNNLLGLMNTGVIVDPCSWTYGEVIAYPCYEVNPYYWCSGDPYYGIGWLATIKADVRDIQTSGPFELIKNKEIEIMLAYEIGRGNSPLNSISVVKSTSDEIQTFFENNFGYPYVLGVNDEQPEKKDFSLYQNYPNPFNPMTTIKYEIRDAGIVQLKVYDILGKEVETLINENQTAGSHSVEFNGKSLSSGVYFYQLKAGSFSKTRKLLLIK